MTIEEKAEEYVESRGKELFKEFYYKQLSMADLLKKCCFEFAKENGVVWHDLRKDPNDLPKKNGDYWVYMNCCGNKITRALVWENGVFCNMYDATIIAWCEIPQFQGVA